jgi:glycosyltransferase involved in cell wall biosynthesis
MRILFASEYYYPSVGGVQEVIRQLAERFARAGHAVTVATTFMPQRRDSTINGVRIEGFKVSGNLVRGIEGEAQRYRDYLLRQDFDVLMVKAAQQWTFDALIPVLDAIRRPKIFIPCGFSGMFDPEYAEYFRAMPEWMSKFDRLIFYASDYRDINLARSRGLTNYSIVPNGADEREFSTSADPSLRERLGIPKAAFVVLTVGSVTGLKGHLELAEAFERGEFGDRKAFLLMVGNRPQAPVLSDGWIGRSALGRKLAYIRTLRRLGGTARVAKWMTRGALESVGLGGLLAALGFPRKSVAPDVAVAAVLKRINAMPNRGALLVDLPRRDVVQAYLNSDLFAFASRVEYSPLVLFEAAAAGLPFVSAPAGNAAEIAAWTSGGIICTANVDAEGYTHVDRADLAHKIAQLAKAPEVRARMGTAARKAWEERFSWEMIFRAYEGIFEECLERTPA